MDDKTATIEVSGASGFITLGVGADQPVSGMVIAARTLETGVTIKGTQIAKTKNPAAIDYDGYEVLNNGAWDPLWCRNTLVTVASGTVRIALGEK